MLGIMNRLVIFLVVLLGFVLALTLLSYRSLKVTQTPFDLHKVESEHKAHEDLKHKIALEHEKAKAGEGASNEEEVQVKEYAPVVELNTPELEKGHKLFGQCISCHGKGGEGKASQKAPFIGGQYDWYIEKQLLDMKSGDRLNPPMATILKGLSPEDIKNLSVYISKLPWKKLEQK